MKKISATLLIPLFLLVSLAACSGSGKDFNTNRAITVVTREEGSGTRGAFIELFGIEVKNDDGTKKDMTTKEAITADKTDIMMTNIAGDPYAVGYISLGSLNGSIKAVEIDGTAASVENVKNGSYQIQRPFHIAVKGEADGLTKDFIGFILSAQGQEVVAANKYIPMSEDAPAFAGSNPGGKIVVAGSSSVTPLMEKLREAYLVINPNAAIEVQMSDSSAGMASAIQGACDIGMASRALKDSELEHLAEIAIALDGIAVIVNNQNPIDGLSGEQVKDIFTGVALQWSDLA
jgi:phosphate transport system substrate-binding protein